MFANSNEIIIEKRGKKVTYDAIQKTLNNEFNVSATENGATGFRTTGKELLDLNFSVSSMRNKSENEVIKSFMRAYFEDKLRAIKWLFFSRDIRGGMGERRLFRIIINHLAKEIPNAIKKIVPLIPEYGRWDDMWNLLTTSLKDDVVIHIANTLADDLENMESGEPVSLLAKWLPSTNTSSQETRDLAKIIVSSLHMTNREYTKLLSQLRGYIKVVEKKMSAGEWGDIEYSAVPSRANLIYNKAFLRHDEERRKEFLDKVSSGEEKINAGTLFPHDIVHKYQSESRSKTIDETLENLWKALPDISKPNDTTIVVADGSGSMQSTIGGTTVSALTVANALAIYFAERCSGEFKDKYITFSSRPQLVDFSKVNTLKEKIQIALLHSEVANTNIEAVFDLILRTAINHNMSQNELPSNILILSDMEFDRGANCSGKRLFDAMTIKYANHGYKLPRMTFWNLMSRSGTIPVKENDLGVSLVSGFSPNTMKIVMENETDPYKALLKVISSERYQPIEDAIIDLL